MKRILLVDDDPNLADSAKDILQDAGYEAEVASTLREARAILAARTMDILVLDFNLPDGKGPVFAQEAKVLQPGLTLILMTGEPLGALDTGNRLFHAILTKPVDPGAFLMLLSNLDQ